LVEIEDKYMRRALQLALKGAGKVSPNPLVGAVLVKEDRIIGEGYHQQYGKAHAEINAINNATESVKDAILYCNLEPCCHSNKQTPPCVPQIIKSGIKKVVIASLDPNPKVSGKGVKQLQQAGLEVVTAVDKAKAEELNRFYFKYTRHRLPYVTLKVAQTLDGYIAREKNKQQWITGDKSQKLVHQWRAIYDAVLIGANTLRVDDARLTVRKNKGKSPKRIILSNSLNLRPDLKIFQQKPPGDTWIFSNRPASRELQKSGCRIITLSSEKHEPILLSDVLKYLAEHKITSLLVEGGQSVFTHFFNAGLIDEIQVFIAPIIWGNGIKSFAKSNAGKDRELRCIRSKKVGVDRLLTFRFVER
jgi:diaminohydroxyphosphoribosylaminopyrimidine deaminase/5-amino-6-(5-phosphoribosylamino)uracil reductase